MNNNGQSCSVRGRDEHKVKRLRETNDSGKKTASPVKDEKEEMIFTKCLLFDALLLRNISFVPFSRSIEAIHGLFHDATNIYLCIWTQKNERNFRTVQPAKEQWSSFGKTKLFLRKRMNQPTNQRINIFCICIHNNEKLHGLMYYATPMNIWLCATQFTLFFVSTYFEESEKKKS